MDLVSAYQNYLLHIKQASDNTVASYMRDVRQFSDYTRDVEGISLSHVDRACICRYITFLNQKGKSSATIARGVASLRSFYSYCVEDHLISENPVYDIPQQKQEKKLPQILTGHEIEELLKQPQCKDYKGFRDKAMLETLYATGMRVSEMISLDVSDVSTIGAFIRCDHNGKARIIPLYPEAVKALSVYISEIRPKMTIGTEETALFVNVNGSLNITNRKPILPKKLHPIPLDIALLLICWNEERICTPYRKCLDIVIFPLHRSILRS